MFKSSDLKYINAVMVTYRLNFRERCLNFVCSLDEIDQICVEDQIFLFRRNLDNAEMMAYVHSFNQKTWTEELEFVLGKNETSTTRS